MIVREIEHQDNKTIAAIIRHSLESVGLNIKGTAYFDPSLDNLTSYYNSLEAAAYWVAEINGEVVGGIGIAPFNQESSTCELQKLYLSPKAQGKGYANLLMETALDFAAKHYNNCYLETRQQLKAACALYEKFEFELLAKPLDGSEHSAMDAWYIKKLN
ncbi:GNAT family N-acetyltransferase [Niallia taxi]|uniref:GNAT family N-acetyltransferase n=1 Tax=Niallia taxi TaxID=2499688 RepID=UPI002E1C340F|nr:GNAT family N-acetyltransferase [Niallia taxi]MED4118706.1 GNAT family N-acetyltransferase [Niallia taxi]